MAPAVAPAAQVRRAVAAVRRQCGRHFDDAQAVQRRLDHHLARELHAGRLQVEREHRFAIEPTQSAMEVTHRTAEEQPADEAQHRVAQIAMQLGHRARADAASEPVAHCQGSAIAQGCDEAAQVREIVAVVRIAHDHEAPASGRDACAQGRAVALDRHVDDARARVTRDRLRAVGRAVVGNENLAGNARLRDEAARLVDAGWQRAILIEAGHQDRQLERAARLAGSDAAR